MGSRATAKTKGTQIRRQLRKVAPWASQRFLQHLSAIADPVERVGALVDRAHVAHRDPSELEAVERYRRGVVAAQPYGIEGRLSDLGAQIAMARTRGAARAVTELERRRLHLLTGWHGRDEAARILYADAPDQPDDTKHRPGWIDPLLRGPARATGQTAAAVRTGRTVTGWQHEAREAT